MMRRSWEMGGARMLRAMGRAVGAGVKENLSAAAGVKENLSAAAGVKENLSAAAGKATAKTHRVVAISSPNSSSFSSSSSSLSNNNKGSLTCFCDGDEWETIGEEVEFDGDVNGFGFRERCVFGPVPSKEETEEAVSTIQQIFVPVTFTQVAEGGYPPYVDKDVDKEVTTIAMHGDSSTESESDWIEPAMHLYRSKSSQAYGQDKILDAFRLLQINPPFKSVVMSLSSDPDVWDAVMKNEAVQELKKSFYEAENSKPHSSEDHDIPKGILSWIMDSTKGKIMEFFDKISNLVNEIFHSHEKDKETDPFNDVLRSSFMLSVVVFIVVAVTRIQRA